MTRKTKRAYAALFRFIEAEICELKPGTFMSDFETALRNALREEYSGVQLKGCYFHYTQALRRQSSKIGGMFLTMNRDPAMSRTYHKFLMLPLLPKSRIPEAFEFVRHEAQQFGGIFTEFVEYVERQWMQKVICLFK